MTGNKELLSVDKMWKDLVDHYEERNALVVAHSFALLRRWCLGNSALQIVKPVLNETMRSFQWTFFVDDMFLRLVLDTFRV